MKPSLNRRSYQFGVFCGETKSHSTFAFEVSAAIAHLGDFDTARLRTCECHGSKLGFWQDIFHSPPRGKSEMS